MLELTQRLAAAAEGGEPVLLAVLVDPGALPLQPGARLLIEPGGSTLGTLGDPALDAAAADLAADFFARRPAAHTRYFLEGTLRERSAEGVPAVYLEVVAARPTFLVVGAGHIGRALARLASFLSYRVAVLDDRPDYADPQLIPEADEVICGDFEAELERFPIGPGTTIVLVTRGHKQDELSLRTCLGRGAAYLGMIGSRRRTTAVLDHLRAEGFPEHELDRVRTPIGLDIGAETPEEIAVSIIAEVILLRRGGTGAPLYYRARRSATPARS
ncbi:XdhC family protein [Tepidiforma sp.]|jgi:xanthine dehydrogenase accessory factor|uniref:XdhC family protein n=1 Tax=Tepidiforma sp. TaxID=2682230 RepID=UPI002609B738|nr:XdhC family protein [Tepidiforma sp.]MCX7618284.1 XdhC family protein [Tepidiforma sp.]